MLISCPPFEVPEASKLASRSVPTTKTKHCENEKRSQRFAQAAAAPPNRPSSAAVGAAPAAAALADPTTEPVMVAGTRVVVGLMPEVKGAWATEEAPAKAGDWVACEGFGVAVVEEGFRTLESRCERSVMGRMLGK